MRNTPQCYLTLLFPYWLHFLVYWRQYYYMTETSRVSTIIRGTIQLSLIPKTSFWHIQFTRASQKDIVLNDAALSYDVYPSLFIGNIIIRWNTRENRIIRGTIWHSLISKTSYWQIQCNWASQQDLIQKSSLPFKNKCQEHAICSQRELVS